MMGWRLGQNGFGSRDSTRDVDQALADLSQTHADSDQTASDRDSSAAEVDSAAAQQDQAGAASDQRASDSDQAASDRDLNTGSEPTKSEQREHDETRDERDEATEQRGETQLLRATSELERIRADADRIETSALRDDVAAERDRAADLREGSVRRSESALLAAYPDNAALRAVVSANSELRDKAMADRRRAASDRQRAAEDRLTAAAAARQARIDVQQAQIDGDTGVFADRVGYAALRGEIDRCRRADDPFVLAFLNIDSLAELTHRQGRPVGEALIDSVVRSLRAKLRTYDPVVRVGGDRFLCGLPGTEPDAAHARVDEIRTAVRNGHPPGTISVGFGVLEASDSLESLVLRAEADMALDRDDR